MLSRLVLLTLAAASITGCGKQGDLLQPAPLFGEAAKAQYKADRARGITNSGPAAANREQDDASPVPGTGGPTRPGAPNNSDGAGAPVNVPPTR